MLSIIEIIQYWTNVMVMKVTYKVMRFGIFEKSGSKPFSSLLSSALHITETQGGKLNQHLIVIKC